MPYDQDPHYVVGDTAGSLRITLQTSAGANIDPAGGTARLYATGFDNGDTPGVTHGGDGTLKSIDGSISPSIVDENSWPAIDFPAIGAACSITSAGVTRKAQAYTYRVNFVDSHGKVWRQTPAGQFVVEAWL